jgi:hypothetical protein
MEFKIIVTAGEILDSGHWDSFCEKRGINEWAMNEGLMDSKEKFVFSLDEAIEIGLGYSLRRALNKALET